MVSLDNEIKVWFRFDNTEELGDFVDYVNKILLDMPIAESKRYAWDCDVVDDYARMYLLLENIPVAKKWVEDFNAQRMESIVLTEEQKALANELTGDMPYPYSLMVNNNPLVTGDDVYVSLDDAKANAEKLLKDDAIESVQVWYHGDVVWSKAKPGCKYRVDFLYTNIDIANDDMLNLDFKKFDDKESAIEFAKKMLAEHKDRIEQVYVQSIEEGSMVWDDVCVVEQEKPKPKLNVRPWREMQIDGDIENLQKLYEKISTIIKKGYIECYYDEGWIDVCYYPNEEEALMKAIEEINNG